MCGGTLEIQPGESVAVCDSCGSKQTIPNLSDERRANLYDRANHFRRANEFDKAMGLYEQILNEDNNDAEAHWSVVLCRYGIEYVEDPATHKRVPTVNRTQYTSILSDEDYKAALLLADGYQRDVYQAEAKAIDEIQKGILAISQREEPFDVFISYKETDASGRRTPDSVLATELYHQLTNEGFKVFLSRITLEDKLGQEYEPYIFAALNSAKVMVVVGTKPEYFNAVWVKNEWSRYLALIRSGEKKTLIPAYRDMDPYDLPDEFSHLMAQDMSKLGFMQDLIRGIKKLTETEKAKSKAAPAASAISMTATNTGSLLKRAFIFLEDGDFKEADEYAERILDNEPENVQAYLVKLMAELRVNRQDKLKDCAMPFDGGKTYQRLMRYADSSLKAELQGYNKYIRERNEENLKAAAYDLAFTMMNAATTENAFLEAAEAFKDVSGYRDGNLKQKLCIEKAEECRKDVIYNNALHLRGQNSEESYKKAIEEFEKIRGWRDSEEQIVHCRRKIEEIKAEQERQILEQKRIEEVAQAAKAAAARKKKRSRLIALLLVIIAAAAGFSYYKFLYPAQRYNEALQLLKAGNDTEAYKAFYDAGNYSDASSYLERFEALLVSEVETGDQKDHYEYSYSFDDAGRLIERIKTGKQWDKSDKRYRDDSEDRKYTYNEKGQLIKEESTYKGGYWDTSERQYEYDNDGYLTKQIDIYDGEIYRISTYENTVVNGKIKSAIHKITYPDNSYQKDETGVIEYDEDGNNKNQKIDGVLFFANRGITLIDEDGEKTYDKKGRVVRIVAEDQDEYRYTYDKYGRVVRRDVEWTITYHEKFSVAYEYEYHYLREIA